MTASTEVAFGVVAPAPTVRPCPQHGGVDSWWAEVERPRPGPAGLVRCVLSVPMHRGGAWGRKVRTEVETDAGGLSRIDGPRLLAVAQPTEIVVEGERLGGALASERAQQAVMEVDRSCPVAPSRRPRRAGVLDVETWTIQDCCDGSDNRVAAPAVAGPRTLEAGGDLEQRDRQDGQRLVAEDPCRTAKLDNHPRQWRSGSPAPGCPAWSRRPSRGTRGRPQLVTMNLQPSGHRLARVPNDLLRAPTGQRPPEQAPIRRLG